MTSWKLKIINILDRIENPAKDWADLLLDKQEPYIQNSLAEIAKAAVPSVKAALNDVSARKLGGLVGHQFAYAQTLATAFEVQTEKLKAIAQAPQMLKAKQYYEDNRSAFTNSSDPRVRRMNRMARVVIKMTEGMEVWLREINEALPSFQTKAKSAIGRCLKIALSQETSESRDFFQGFAKALEMGTLTKHGTLVGMTSATTIYFVIVVYGESLRRRLKNVNQFHAVLTANFGHNLAGDLARTQKLCNRIGLQFGKPGRPRKIKTRT